MKAYIRWSLVVLALLIGSMIIHSIMLVFAVSDPAFSVEPGYEATAANWDDVVAQRRLNRELGWAVTLSTEPVDRLQGAVTVEVIDRAGTPLSDARVNVVAFYNARAQHRYSAELEADGPGRYVGVIPMRRSGVWEFRVSVEFDGQLLTDVIRQSVTTLPRSPGNAA